MKAQSPAKQLEGFIAKYAPEIAAFARAALARMRARLPGAIQLVGDTYNALVVGFGPTERAADAIFSIVLYPRWVTLFFLRGAGLPDPHRLLKGSGKVVRHIVLEELEVLDKPAVQELLAQALASARTPLESKGRTRIVIKSIAAKQGARRPAE